jgi:Fur family iron response transcriptional regulator
MMRIRCEPGELCDALGFTAATPRHYNPATHRARWLRRTSRIRRPVYRGVTGTLTALRARVERRLRQRGVKPTPQRVQIGMIMLARPCHMSADQILQSLRDAGSPVSKATVYNTLNLFSRTGILREVAVDPARLVYDSTTSVHHHFYNEDTGELIDIDPGQVELSRLPRLPDGTRAASVELLIRVRRRTSPV